MVIGIDCSKATLDVGKSEGGKAKSLGSFLNNPTGFMRIYELAKSSRLVVMEASGPYYMPWHIFLKKEEFLYL
ncbi:hypothetical protein [Sporocytophaga myxococcoides]|uniref:hypothetical protein n=1 Tax=Sporocytophaga myxococcoides TaxID=153721 RepID=UPI00040EE546|nr:hypothetical protein [Sporocytophaga myxococcoides]